MAVPNWITNNLLEVALRQFLDAPITVLECIGNPVSGENFASYLFRATVKYISDKSHKSEELAVLIKRKPEAKGILTLIEELSFFDREIEMYQHILPRIHNILGDTGTLSPRCVYTQTTPFPMLVIENISPMGYKIADRHKGLDLEHCLRVVEKMALMHSASLIIGETSPDVFKNFSIALLWGTPVITQWIHVAVESLIHACDKDTEFQKYAVKLQRIKDDIPVRCRAASETNPSEFRVLNHGDAWTNNFLFSYDSNGNIKDTIMIDYQAVVYGSPAIDLHYFWASAPSIEVNYNHLHTVLDHYYNQLELSLKRLQFVPKKFPTKEEFKKDWFARSYYGLASALIIMPLVKSSNREDANVDNMLAPEKGYEGTYRHHAFNNVLAWERFRYLLQLFDQAGIFDY